MNKAVIMVTTAKGLEKFLMQEVKALGLPVTWAGISGVKTEGTFIDAMRLNLHLRTGHRVLYLLRQCSCANPDELYKAVNAILWETVIPADGYVSVVANVVNDTVKDTRFAGLKCKDAIVDRIFRHKGLRPDSGPLQNRAVVNLFWRADRCEIYLDTSGEPLSKRGYRKRPLEAPLQETLAAGIVLASGWNGSGPFINPMCGSGTLAIEAALIASSRAPGLLRQSFGFMHTLKYDKGVWTRLRDEARAAIKKIGVSIVSTDIRPTAVEAARNNAQTAGVDRLIEFSACDFYDTPVPEGNGIVVLNPEYGLRMGKESELCATYRRIGDFFKKKCKGKKGYIFTGNTALAGKVGLKSKRRMNFHSGDLECKLYEYEIY